MLSTKLIGDSLSASNIVIGENSANKGVAYQIISSGESFDEGIQVKIYEEKVISCAPKARVNIRERISQRVAKFLVTN